MIHNTYRQTDYKELWKQESTELARDVKNIWEQAKKKKTLTRREYVWEP